MSNTEIAGLAIVSPKIAFVFGFIFACISSSVASASTKIHSIPKRLNVTAKD